jgi:hypothetical protein
LSLIIYFVGVLTLRHKPKHVDVGLKSLTASRNVSLDLSCSHLSFLFNNSTQKYVLTCFSENPSKK